ncbi:cupin domain-containing protein [Streptomyces anandii]|uniref:cupin domain-containing protein n=1 Tax=Streptomyces anandii TaxID=285454 RepID=UPI001678CD20|nr:cupin domain-containing protein [Streptomyces anandii]GGY08401.1 cupin [Streptomyces anandii JCM 4720]
MTEEVSSSESQAGPAVSVVAPGDGETIVLGTTRMRVLEDGSHTEHRLAIAESVLAPHTQGPPQHRHDRHDEGFYVLSGTVRFTVGDRDYDATAGTLVMVPPGTPHTFANPTGQPAVMLSTFTPDLYVQYFRDLQDVLTDGRPLTPQANIDVMSRYGTEPAAGQAVPPAPAGARRRRRTPEGQVARDGE